MNEQNTTIGQRYRLLALLGSGGMGAVFQAHDRLTGQTVALKQVQVAPQALAFASRPATDDTQGLLLALAQEFKLLASLRHPNVISVLDYGFDAERLANPFLMLNSLKALGDVTLCRQAYAEATSKLQRARLIALNPAT
jgi:serine/threonine protein kinase